ncbi:MAG: aminopeptidase [Candidatus Hecatellales archaeon]|nr:MAG: aminopeptidase [Candidatus Hecatellales archaeon]
MLIPLEGEATLYISRMGSLQTSKEAKIGLKIREVASPEDFSRKLKTEAGRFKGLGFDDAPYSLISRLKKAGLRLAQHAEAVVKLRQVKEAWEIKAIRRAVRLAEEALAEASKYVKPGVSELEVAAAAERVLRLGGSEFYPFSTLVASGFRASYPHAEPTRKKIRDGEPVVVDLGAKVSGYCADLTRTFFAGKPGEAVAEAWRAVLEARDEAIRGIKPGMTGSEADRLARETLAKHGLEKFFIHGLGHGVGLEVHEAPSLSSAGKEKLVEGMVFTVEPGVYVAGRFGVRVEDTVLLEKGGVKLLTGKLGRELISLL